MFLFKIRLEIRFQRVSSRKLSTAQSNLIKKTKENEQGCFLKRKCRLNKKTENIRIC